MITTKLLGDFAEECKLNQDDLIIVGVSGGADSLCLLDLLIQSGYQVVVAYFNHGIRPEAKEEAETINQIGSSLDVPVILGIGDVPEHARRQRLSLEESARILRYQFLFQQARSYNAQAVAVAHTADDQVETLLLHLLRGSGLQGLSGMASSSLPNPWSDSIPLVRPLLKVWKEDIDAYCRENKLVPILDRTNLDVRYLRNHLRHELIPVMDEIIPGFRKRLSQTAELLRADQDVLDNLTETLWKALVVEIREGYIAIDFVLLKQQPLGLQRRVIRRFAQELLGTLHDVDYHFVERVLDFCADPKITQEIDAGLGIRVFLEEKRLYIALSEAFLPTDLWPQISEETMVMIPDEIKLGPHWKIVIKRDTDFQEARMAALNNKDPYLAWIDPGDEKFSIRIRGRKVGECFKPFGMDGRSVKLSDYMINQKIPRRARESWPLVFINDEIAWVVGHHLAHPFRLSGKIHDVIKLELLHL